MNSKALTSYSGTYTQTINLLFHLRKSGPVSSPMIAVGKVLLNPGMIVASSQPVWACQRQSSPPATSRISGHAPIQSAKRPPFAAPWAAAERATPHEPAHKRTGVYLPGIEAWPNILALDASHSSRGWHIIWSLFLAMPKRPSAASNGRLWHALGATRPVTCGFVSIIVISL